jgi:plant 4,4-dimethylsterol C-4alpha-methyl-monooxygenase
MIPYATVEAAEAALGRGLTWAEAAWFWHSGSTPDYCLYFESLVILLAAYSLTPLPLALIELYAPAKLTTPYKLQPQVRLSPAAFLRCYKDTARVLVLLTIGPLLYLPYPIVKVHTHIQILHPTCYYFSSIQLFFITSNIMLSINMHDMLSVNISTSSS